MEWDERVGNISLGVPEIKKITNENPHKSSKEEKNHKYTDTNQLSRHLTKFHLQSEFLPVEGIWMDWSGVILSWGI